MTGPSSLAATEARIHQAIITAQYEEAGRLVAAYCAEAGCAGARHPDDAREIAARAQGLLDWARRAVLSTRSHTAAQLQGLPRLERYAQRRAESSTWRLDA